ncbi:MAG: NAD(P)H-dependent dehydrogenase/reductase [Deltaproteobacteria bacterium RBG_16_47_11]|nr:MAG: NAD(P)H-dependent dehydrogenase/reductase [Deltaproteobacteria bacterium RBG_16_47_11]
MIDILRTRRSIRKYEKKAIERQSLEVIKEAVLRSPSSRSINPWTFIFVDDPDVLKQLARAREHGSDFLKGAALGIVVCGDETQSDVWIEDCTIAAIVLHFTAHSLGLGGCWIQIRNRAHSKEKTAEAYVQEILGIPKNLKVESIISIGFPAETKPPNPADKLDYRKINHNHYGKLP